MAGVKGRSGGGNRKSVAELELLGTFRKDRHGHLKAPDGKLMLLLPQEHIFNNNYKPDREKIFAYFAYQLHESGQSQEIDSILLSQLVEAYCIYVEAIMECRIAPDAMYGKKLASDVALTAGKDVRVLLGEFRLTPSTRRVQTNTMKEVESRDEIDDIMNADFTKIK